MKCRSAIPVKKRALWSLCQMLVVVLMHAPANSQSSDQIVWFPPIRLTDSLYDSFEPVIDISGADTIHLTWWEGSYHHRVPYRRSTDGGQTWESIKELAVDTLMFPTVFLGHKMVVKDDQVWIFTGSEPDPPGPGRMALFRSTDAGTTWTGERTAFQGTTNIKSASVNGDTMVVVYMPEIGGHLEEPRLIYSTDDGYNWTMHPDTFHYWTSAALTPGTLHVIVNDVVNEDLEIQYLRSTNLGQTFEPAVTLSPLDDRGAHEHDLITRATPRGMQIAVAWRDAMECYGEVGCTILFRASTDNGVSWGMTTPITESPMGYDASVTFAPDGRPGVAWSQEIEWRSPVHTFTRLEAWNELYWLPPYDNSAPSTSSGAPDITISSTAVHVVWGEVLHDVNGHWVLYYQRGEFVRENELVVTYGEGWNLVSIPMEKDTTYDNFTNLYAFEGSQYVPATIMEAGKGYWAKVNWHTVRFEGDSLTVDTIEVRKGWNIIGSISSPVGTSSITTVPGGIVSSGYFAFSNSQYQEVTTIEPGRGCWVKVNQNGSLILKKD